MEKDKIAGWIEMAVKLNSSFNTETTRLKLRLAGCKIDDLIREGYLENETLLPTKKSKLFLDDLQAERKREPDQNKPNLKK